MNITTTHNTITVNCADSSALESLTIVDDSIVVARYKGQTTNYIYTLGTGNLLAELVKHNSAGKFVSLFVKPMATLVVKATDNEAVVL